MRPLLLLAGSALAITATGCAPKAPNARAALDCPASQGDLTRTSASADGKTCIYTSSGGAEVTLQLVSTGGNVDSALSAIEARLLATRVPNAADKDGAEGKSETPEKADAKSAASAADAEAQARSDSAKGGIELSADLDKGVKVDGRFDVDGKQTDAVNVEMKGGRTVVTESKDGTTRVNLPGIHVEANDHDDSARVQIGPIKIDAGGDASTVRIRRDVRLRGEALNPERRGVRATFIYTGKDLPGGYNFVGYEAGGPKRGPITVAVVKSKSGDLDDNEIYPDVKRLVRKNGGV